MYTHSLTAHYMTWEWGCGGGGGSPRCEPDKAALFGEIIAEWSLKLTDQHASHIIKFAPSLDSEVVLKYLVSGTS